MSAGGLQSFGRKGGKSEVFASDLLVSLSGGKTIGKYPTGSTIPAKGKSPVEVITDLAAESIYPGYSLAGVGVAQSAPALGEVGETLTQTITGYFYQNDAGAVQRMVILKNGAQLGAASASNPVSVQDTVKRTLTNWPTYQAAADYAAGPKKLVQPAGTPDPRAAQVRNPNTPQAAETGLQSGGIQFGGNYRYFYGPAAVVPTTSAEVRALANKPLSSQRPNPCILDTGNSQRVFVVAVPYGVTLTSVIDQSALGANLTGQYQNMGLIQVADAGGAMVPYTLFAMQSANTYSTSHQHYLTFSA